MGVLETLKNAWEQGKDAAMVEALKKALGMGEGPRDALDLLKSDHELVAGIFDQLESIQEKEDPAATREGLLGQLTYELETHASIEERIFYPALREAPLIRELIPEALEEHKLVKQLLSELDALPVGTEEWTAKLKVLRENVEHHVREEENEIFPRARKALSKAELEYMGERLQVAKKRSVKDGGAAADQGGMRDRKRQESGRTARESSHQAPPRAR